nr:hypothetical protein CFP56_78896 [Quercus suber]
MPSTIGDYRKFLLCSRHRRKNYYTFTYGVFLSLYYNCGTGYIVSNKVYSSLGSHMPIRYWIHIACKHYEEHSLKWYLYKKSRRG